MDKRVIIAAALAGLVIYGQSITIKNQQKKIQQLTWQRGKWILGTKSIYELFEAMKPYLPSDYEIPKEIKQDFDFYKLVKDL